MVWNDEKIELINWKSDVDCRIKDPTLVEEKHILILSFTYLVFNSILNYYESNKTIGIWTNWILNSHFSLKLSIYIKSN
jgi:hypothetical protein